MKKFALILSVLILSGLAACSKQADRAQDDRFDVNKHSDMANIYKQYEATPAPGK